MYSGQGLVTTNRRSAAGSSLKYAEELNVVADVGSIVIVCEQNIPLHYVPSYGTSSIRNRSR